MSLVNDIKGFVKKEKQNSHGGGNIMEIEPIKSVGKANSGVPEYTAPEIDNYVRTVEETQKTENLAKKAENDKKDKKNMHDENCNDNCMENKKVAKSTIDSTISETNSKIKMANTQLKYSVDDETQRISIKVIDKHTDEVIREIPPEETLEAIKKIWEIAGIIVDEKR